MPRRLTIGLENTGNAGGITPCGAAAMPCGLRHGQLVGRPTDGQDAHVQASASSVGISTPLGQGTSDEILQPPARPPLGHRHHVHIGVGHYVRHIQVMTWITQLRAMRDDRAHMPRINARPPHRLHRRLPCNIGWARSWGARPVPGTCLTANFVSQCDKRTMTNHMTNVNAPRVHRSIRPPDWGRRPIPTRSRHRTGTDRHRSEAGQSVSACRPPDPRVPASRAANHSQSSRLKPNGSCLWVHPLAFLRVSLCPRPDAALTVAGCAPNEPQRLGPRHGGQSGDQGDLGERRP